MAKSFSMTDTAFLREETRLVVAAPDGKRLWLSTIPIQDVRDKLKNAPDFLPTWEGVSLPGRTGNA